MVGGGGRWGCAVLVIGASVSSGICRRRAASAASASILSDGSSFWSGEGEVRSLGSGNCVAALAELVEGKSRALKRVGEMASGLRSSWRMASSKLE
jgi:hypothetical protein